MGGSGRGGSSAGGSGGGGGTPICGPASAFATGDGGYIRAAPWHGYAFAATESPSLGTTMVPTSFSAFRAGDAFAAYGYVKGDPDPALRGFALVGFNLNQDMSATPSAGAPWAPTGCGGVAFDLDLTDSWILPRIQLTAATGSAPQTWCAQLASGRPGNLPWSSFNISCADGSAITPFDGVSPLVSVALLMPGGTVPYQDQSNYFDFVVHNLAPY